MERTAPEIKTAARGLRNNATEAERILWSALRPTRPRWTRQLCVGHFIVDLACRSLKLAVELDGAHHADQIEQDEARTAYLEAHGWRVLRFWNNDVTGNLDGVVVVVLAEVASRASTHPRPLPSREGRNRESR